MHTQHARIMYVAFRKLVFMTLTRLNKMFCIEIICIVLYITPISIPPNHYLPSSMRLGVVGVECKKLVLMRASCPNRPDRVMSKGLRKLLEVISSSLRVEPMARLIPSPRSTLSRGGQYKSHVVIM